MTILCGFVQLGVVQTRTERVSAGTRSLRRVSLLIGTAKGAYALEGEPRALIEGTRINHLARSETTWWAADGKGRIHRDGEHIASVPDGVTPLCIQPTPETVWVGASEARLYGIENGSIEEDEFFADAPGRSDWHTPWGGPPDVRSMALDADHTLYINVHVGGILRYDSTGLVPTLDISADVHEVAAHPTLKGAVFAATAHGLAQTHNGHDFDFRTGGLHANYCRAVAVLDDQVILSASTGPTTSKGKLYRGALWDGPFEPIHHGLPDWFQDNVNTHCVVAHQGDLYAGLGDAVWTSSDRGESWDAVAAGLPKVTCLA